MKAVSAKAAAKEYKESRQHASGMFQKLEKPPEPEAPVLAPAATADPAALAQAIAAPGRIRATTRRASRSRPGWRPRRSGAACRPSCR